MKLIIYGKNFLLKPKSFMNQLFVTNSENAIVDLTQIRSSSSSSNLLNNTILLFCVRFYN